MCSSDLHGAFVPNLLSRPRVLLRERSDKGTTKLAGLIMQCNDLVCLVFAYMSMEDTLLGANSPHLVSPERVATKDMMAASFKSLRS